MKKVFGRLVSICFVIPGLMGSNSPMVNDSFQTIEKYDFIEITREFKVCPVNNPFTDIKAEAVFTIDNGEKTVISGFCDSQDGLIFRFRFMPLKSGNYTYETSLSWNKKTKMSKGAFKVIDSDKNGPLRTDPDHPWHFIREGSEKHFFWNSTTTYWMLGWNKEQIIFDAIDRLNSYEINRIRVAMNGRQDSGKRWHESNVVESEDFSFKLSPWVAERPMDLDNPGFDVSRFNIAHWQKLDHLVAHARKYDMVVSLIFYLDGLDHGCDPFKKENMGDKYEQMYYRYAVARYSAYSNIMWDVTNEYHLFRSEEWVNKMGTLLYTEDPVKHLISVHGHAEFPFRTSPWVGLVLFQSWDECGGYDFISSCREKQAATGNILPQVNEEYGYQDHYPPWGCGATATKELDGRSAENRIKLAWEIYMAGGYQTTGERANDGTGAGKDNGGGWINGRGNDSMTMLAGYRIIKHIFERVPYWEMDPRNDLVNYGNLCLAREGEEYLVYSRLSSCRVVLPKGIAFTVKMINPRTGEEKFLKDTNAENWAWQYPRNLDEDWIFIITKK